METQALTAQDVFDKYEGELKKLAEDPSTVVESTWRGLLASFAFELAATQS